jgi:hypothetical protein
MITYLLDIIPSIQRYSERLNNLTLLENKQWVLLDEQNPNRLITYIFRSNKDLLISNNSIIVETAEWDFIDSNTLFIELGGQGYILSHGFINENILALKLQYKMEYAVFVKKEVYDKALNSIESVKNYLQDLTNIKISFVGNGYTLKMGSYKEYCVNLSNGKSLDIYQKTSNGKYFIYERNQILLFQDKDTCINYLQQKY